VRDLFSSFVAACCGAVRLAWAQVRTAPVSPVLSLGHGLAAPSIWSAKTSGSSWQRFASRVSRASAVLANLPPGMSLEAERLLLGLLLLVTAAACRSHVALCDDQACRAAGGAGQGGAAGAGTEQTCSRDAECRDDLKCDGVEKCLDGGCVEGEAHTCPARMHCREDQPAADPCVYDDPSPWLLIAAGSRLLAIPSAEIGQRDPLVLAEREFAPGWLRGYVEPTWSPDGAQAIVTTREDDWGNSFAEVHFGRGNPTPAKFLRDVPRWGIFSDNCGFTPDSQRAFVHDSERGLFFVSFAEPPEPTLLLPEAVPGTFCSDASTWVQHERRMSLSGGELIKSALSERIAVSPDGNWLVQIGAEASLESCSGGGRRADLGVVDDALFSPSSTHLLLTEYAGTSRILSVDPAAPVWSAGDVLEVAFSPNGARALVTALDEPYSFLELDGDREAPPIPLALPADVEVLSLADDGLLAARPVPDGGAELIWVPLEAESRAQVLLDHPSEGSWLLSADRPDLHLFLVEPSEVIGDRELTLVARSPTGLAVYAVEKMAQEASLFDFSYSPDGRGFALSIADYVASRRATWVPLDKQGVPGEPFHLAEDPVGLEFQP
jgi:hypothetical protein